MPAPPGVVSWVASQSTELSDTRVRQSTQAFLETILKLFHAPKKNDWIVVGGLIMRGVNAFDMMFAPPHSGAGEIVSV